MRRVLLLVIITLFLASCSSGGNSKTEGDAFTGESDAILADHDIIKNNDDETGNDSDVEIISTWKTVKAGTQHTCGIKTNGKLYCWGWNDKGQLGNGTITTVIDEADTNDIIVDDNNKTVPTKIGDDEWYKIAVGTFHTCGIKEADRKLYCWGGCDFSGQDTKILSPTKIDDDAWVEITAGQFYSCGIKTDNKLYCWGDNVYGQLGDGTSDYRITPEKIGDDTWLAISAGYEHTCGIKTDSTLYCWGFNYEGELGDGTFKNDSNKFTPVKIGNDTWIEIATGYGHTCGVKTDNTLYCWGRNDTGQIGDGTSCQDSSINCADRNVPTKISDDTWLEVAAGTFHSCAIKKSDNKRYCWGYNGTGELGDGTDGEGCPDNKGYPGNCADKIIPAETDDDAWVEITAGHFYSCGIKTDNRLYCWGVNRYGQLGDGTMTAYDITGSIISGANNNKNIPTLVAESF